MTGLVGRRKRHTLRLPLTVVRVNGERFALVALDADHRVAGKLVNPLHTLVAPIRHKQVILEQSNAVQAAHLYHEIYSTK